MSGACTAALRHCPSDWLKASGLLSSLCGGSDLFLGWCRVRQKQPESRQRRACWRRRGQPGASMTSWTAELPGWRLSCTSRAWTWTATGEGPRPRPRDCSSSSTWPRRPRGTCPQPAVAASSSWIAVGKPLSPSAVKCRPARLLAHRSHQCWGGKLWTFTHSSSLKWRLC